MMKRKLKKNDDIVVLMAKVQEQLAVLDNKLDAFMTKSLTELAQALAASKPAPVRLIPDQNQRSAQPIERPGRPMYAVICFECGADCEIPFKPSSNRPVFCKICFAKRKGSAQKPSPLLIQSASSPALGRFQPSTISAPDSKARKKSAAKKTGVKKKASPTKKTRAEKKPSAKRKAAPKKKVVSKKRR